MSAKALRSRLGKALACLDRGESGTITYRCRPRACRGKPRARLVGIETEDETAPPGVGDGSAFGMWKDRSDVTDVDACVRELRKRRGHAAGRLAPAH